MTCKRLLAVAAILAVLGLPLSAQAANQYTSTVSVTSVNSVVTFGLNAVQVIVLNDGPSPVYVDLAGTASSSDTAAVQLNTCQGGIWNFPSQNKLASLNIASAGGQTATARVSAFGSIGAFVAGSGNPADSGFLPLYQPFAHCASPSLPSSNVSIPSASGNPSLSVFEGVPASGTNLAGGGVVIAPGPATGTAAGSPPVKIQRNITGSASGATADAITDAFVPCPTKTLSNTTGTTTALAGITTTNNSAGALEIINAVFCTDGTNFDADAIRCSLAYVNKAGVVSITAAPVCTTTVGINNSGSCTVAQTFTAAGAVISSNVTPAIGTIVPTLTTGGATIIQTAGAPAPVTCN